MNVSLCYTYKTGIIQSHTLWSYHMNENEIAKVVCQNAFDLHRELGPGLLESVYEFLLSSALLDAGLKVKRQESIPIAFRGQSFDVGFRADIVVEDLVLVELKSIEKLAMVHRKQVLTYLKLSGLRLGLLINFGAELMKGNIERLVNNLAES